MGAIQGMQAGQAGVPASPRLSAEDSRQWLAEHVWALPLLDVRSADKILGDDEEALC